MKFILEAFYVTYIRNSDVPITASTTANYSSDF